MEVESPPDDLADRLHALAVRLVRQARHATHPPDVTTARMSALSVLVAEGPLTVGELAAAENVRSPTASKVTAELEAVGLVKRARSIGDRRVTEVRATPRGQWMLQASQRQRAAPLAARLESLTQVEMATLDRAADLLEELLRDRGS